MNKDELLKRINDIENDIKKLVIQYENAQNRYHGDNGISKNIEGKIDNLECEQYKLKQQLMEA